VNGFAGEAKGRFLNPTTPLPPTSNTSWHLLIFIRSVLVYEEHWVIDKPSNMEDLLDAATRQSTATKIPKPYYGPYTWSSIELSW